MLSTKSPTSIVAVTLLLLAAACSDAGDATAETAMDSDELELLAQTAEEAEQPLAAKEQATEQLQEKRAASCYETRYRRTYDRCSSLGYESSRCHDVALDLAESVCR